MSGSDPIKSTLVALRDMISLENNAIQSELSDVIPLLRDAARELESSFRAIYAERAASNTVDKPNIIEAGTKNNLQLGQTNRRRVQRSNEIDNIVRCLQFEDMVTQKIDYVQRRLAIAEEMTTVLATITAGMTEPKAEEKIDNTGLWRQAHHEVDKLQDRLNKTLSPVAQKDIGEGDIELF